MPPGKTGVSVRKTARYAGNKRGPLHLNMLRKGDRRAPREHRFGENPGP